MFDVTSTSSYKKISKLWENIVHTCDHIPLVICGNKADIKERIVIPSSDITLHHRYGNSYYDISVKSNHNYDKPFLSLLRGFTGDTNLKILEPEEDLKSNDKSNDKYIKELENELKQVNNYDKED